MREYKTIVRYTDLVDKLQDVVENSSLNELDKLEINNMMYELKEYYLKGSNGSISWTDFEADIEDGPEFAKTKQYRHIKNAIRKKGHALLVDTGRYLWAFNDVSRFDSFLLSGGCEYAVRFCIINLEED